MKDVKNYRDYKQYLKDVYAAKIEINPRFSFAVWAKSIGISSPSLLSMVINGTRHPSKKLAQKLSIYLNHTPEQTHHFQGIIDLHKASLNPYLSVDLKGKSTNDLGLIVKEDKYDEAKKLLEDFKSKMSELVTSESVDLTSLNVMVKNKSVNETTHSQNL